MIGGRMKLQRVSGTLDHPPQDLQLLGPPCPLRLPKSLGNHQEPPADGC